MAHSVSTTPLAGRPAGPAEPSVGTLAKSAMADMSTLIRSEIELAKTEVTVSAKRGGIGAAAFAAAGVMLAFAAIFFFIALAELLNDLFWDDYPWAGYGVVAALFLIITIVLVLVGLRLIKKGSPPSPDMAIEEAKATKAVLEEARS